LPPVAALYRDSVALMLNDAKVTTRVGCIMSGDLNHQIRLGARPLGLPKRGDWQFTEEPAPQPRDGEVLVRVLYISLDPAMRGWMNEGKSYIPPVALGEVMRAGALGKVVQSKHPGFTAGDYVAGAFGVQEYAALAGTQLTKVDPRVAPLPRFLNTLGMPGMTAYFGLLDVGTPKEGDTVVVSGAAGSTAPLFRAWWVPKRNLSS